MVVFTSIHLILFLFVKEEVSAVHCIALQSHTKNVRLCTGTWGSDLNRVLLRNFKFSCLSLTQCCGSRSGGGILQARTFGARTRTFCSVPEHFVPCPNKMYFFKTFLTKKKFIYFLRSLNYILSVPNLFISV
jgi:hypothetical protein